MFRSAVLLAKRWPLLAPQALALVRCGLLTSPKNIDFSHTARFRESVVEFVADLALAGHGRPVLEYVQGHAGEWDLQLVRRVLTRLLTAIDAGTPGPAGPGGASRMSPDFALTVTRLIALAQRRIKASLAAEGSSAGAGAGSGGGSVVLEGKRKLVSDFLKGVYAVYERCRIPEMMSMLVSIDATAREQKIL